MKWQLCDSWYHCDSSNTSGADVPPLVVPSKVGGGRGRSWAGSEGSGAGACLLLVVALGAGHGAAGLCPWRQELHPPWRASPKKRLTARSSSAPFLHFRGRGNSVGKETLPCAGAVGRGVRNTHSRVCETATALWVPLGVWKIDQAKRIYFQLEFKRNFVNFQKCIS